MELIQDTEKETCDELEGGDLAAYKDIDLKNYVRHFEYLAIRQGLWSKVNCELRHRFDKDYQAYLKLSSPSKRCCEHGMQTIPKNMADKERIEKQLQTIYNHSNNNEVIGNMDHHEQQQSEDREVTMVIEKWQSEANHDTNCETSGGENLCKRIKLTIQENSNCTECKTSYFCECCGMQLSSFGSALDHIKVKNLSFLEDDLSQAHQGTTNNILLVEIENEPSALVFESLVKKENFNGMVNEGVEIDSLSEATDGEKAQKLLVDFTDGSDPDWIEHQHEENEADDNTKHRPSSSGYKLASKPIGPKTDLDDEDAITYETSCTLPLMTKKTNEKIRNSDEELDNIMKTNVLRKTKKKRKVWRFFKECVAYTFVIFF